MSDMSTSVNDFNDYEKSFDDFYAREFSHDKNISRKDLLLNAYPYTIEINVPDGGLWLELGAGSGRVVDYHRDRLNKFKCVAIDISPSGIEHCRRLLPNDVELLVGDVKNLPPEITNRKYDLITLFGTIQAFEKQEWFKQLNQMRSLLKDGGRIGFSLHPNSALEYIRCMVARKNFGNIVSRGYLERELEAIGLKGKFRIEKHDSYTLLMKFTSLFGLKPVRWFGFMEYRDTKLYRSLTKWFKRIFPPFTFGHWWIWIEK